MTDKDLRTHSKMSAFTFYLDDMTKLKVLQKLKANGCDTQKGSLSALIRVLLNLYAELPDDDPNLDMISKLVVGEYLFTTRKNKRSTL
jgi:hypothetical protein